MIINLDKQNKRMKYSFDKFKIQLVSKPNTSKSKKNRYNQTKQPILHHNLAKTSIVKRKNIPDSQILEQVLLQTQPSSIKSTYKNLHKSESLNNSEGLKPQIHQDYSKWLAFSNLTSHQKIQQYRIFEQKCIDLLTKKRVSSNRITKRSNNQHFKTSNDGKCQYTVHDMMNNIIDKFRNTNHKTYQQKLFNNHQTRNSKHYQHQSQFHQSTEIKTNKRFLTKNSMVKSTQLKRTYSQNAKNSKVLDSPTKYSIENLQQSPINIKRYGPQLKQDKQIVSSRVNKIFFNQNYPHINPIICTKLTPNYINQVFPLRKAGSSFQQICKKTSSSKRKIIHLSKAFSKIKFMKFTKNATSDDQYNKRLKSFLDFLFKINFSNNIYINLQLKSLEDIKQPTDKYKVFVGLGNNSNLIKSLIKRRPWMELVNDSQSKDLNFVWTQNRMPNFHNQQQKSLISKTTPNTNHQRRRSSINVHDTIQQNTKILQRKKAQAVQEYIFKDGYQVPFKEQYRPTLVTNHLPQNYVIGSKKNLFKSMFSYYTNILKKDPFTVIPKTYHIKSVDDPQFKRFMSENKSEPNRLWILKPGENTNRGSGILLKKLSQIHSYVSSSLSKHANGHPITYMLQSYMAQPLLYNNRKFDIRHFMLVSSINGILKCYWYRDGYIRTSSEQYDIQDYQNQFIHLTNDAIQLKSQNYSKYQEANKLGYHEFQRYLDMNHQPKAWKVENLLNSMKHIIIDVVKASYLNLDKDRKKDNFQIFGFDFMVDKDFNPYLIQINFNPCLNVNCNVLNRIIPPMVQSSLRVGLDPLLPPKCHLPINKRNYLNQNYLKNLRYELIFDEANLQCDIFNKPQLQNSEDQQQQYVDNGNQISEDINF